MATGMPSAKNKNDIAPLKVKRIKDAPLVSMGAFKSVSQKEDKKTKEKYEVEQVKLSLDFDTGHIMRNEDGEPIYNQAGDEQPHYLNEGFVTLSGDHRAKLVAIIKALGLDDPRFIVQTGDNAGALTQEAVESVEAEFGTNGLNDDYSGMGWDDLPFYVNRADGGQLNKRDVEVPVLSFKILGVELIGRHLDMSITIKGGYNRVEAYFPSEEPAPLAKPPAKKPARAMPADTVTEDPFVKDEPARASGYPVPTTKAAKYTHKVLMEAGVPEAMHVAVVQAISGFDDFDSIAEISNDAASNFRDMFKNDPTIVQSAREHVASQGSSVPFTPNEADDEDDF